MAFWAACENALASTVTALVAAGQSGCAKVGEGHLVKVLALGKRLNCIEIDGLVLYAVKALEAPFGKTTLQWHLATFETDFTFITRTRFGTFVSACGCAALAGTLSATHAGLIAYRADGGLYVA